MLRGAELSPETASLLARLRAHADIKREFLPKKIEAMAALQSPTVEFCAA